MHEVIPLFAVLAQLEIHTQLYLHAQKCLDVAEQM